MAKIVRYLNTDEEPTKEHLEKIYKAFKPKGITDFFRVTTCHIALLSYIEKEPLEGPGRYRVQVRFTIKKPWLYYTKVTKVSN